MIVDRIEKIDEYMDRFPCLKTAMEMIREDPGMDNSKHFFPGGFVMHQIGKTRAEKDGGYEVHRKYIDVQMLVGGREVIFWNHKDFMDPLTPYDENVDKEMLQGDGAPLEMHPGMFCVMFPTDAHAACRYYAGEEPNPFEKYVVKVEIV